MQKPLSPTPKPPPAPPNSGGSPVLVISGLRFRYPLDHADGTPPPTGDLVDVHSLTLAPGEQLLLTGGSGSGKSTLLHLIAGLIDPRAGRVTVAGQNVHSLAPAARDRLRGREIGMIFQTFNLLPGFSALENVMLAMMFADPKDLPPREHRGRASDLLARLGLPAGRLHEADVTKLSIGQQQRVAVARAIACKPTLVLADEPTASLDPENRDAAIELIQSACRDTNAALLCVSHDPAIASRFARRVKLADLRSDAAPSGPLDANPQVAQAGRWA